MELEVESRSGSAALAAAAGGVLHRAPASTTSCSPRAYEAIVPPSLQRRRQGASSQRQRRRRDRRRRRRAAAARRGGSSGLGLIALLAAVFPANLYMARDARALPQDPALGAVRAPAAAAADDVVGVEGDAAMTARSPESRRRTLLCSLEQGFRFGPPCRPRPPSRSRPPSRRHSPSGSCAPGAACCARTPAWPSASTPSSSARTGCR